MLLSNLDRAMVPCLKKITHYLHNMKRLLFCVPVFFFFFFFFKFFIFMTGASLGEGFAVSSS
jgi:hypothetical protein